MYVPPRQRALSVILQIEKYLSNDLIACEGCLSSQVPRAFPLGRGIPLSCKSFEGSTRTFSIVEIYFMGLLLCHNPYMVYSFVGLILPIWETSIYKMDQSRCLRNVMIDLLPICVVARCIHCIEFLCWDDVRLFYNASSSKATQNYPDLIAPSLLLLLYSYS